MDELQNGAVTRTYAYGLERISEDQLIGGTWTPSFYRYDGHGSTRFLTNMAGTVTDTYQYDAFGNVISSTGSTPNEFLFVGEQFDPALGFYYMRARYYRPATGRFWTTDPIEGRLCCGLSWNPYIYVLDNPVNRIDPAGDASLAEYRVQIQNRVFSIALHAAHHPFDFWIIGTYYCIHVQVLTYLLGVKGSGRTLQIPLPWCSEEPF